MIALCNFQYRNFHSSTPDYLTILSLIFTIIGASATIAAIIAAYRIYTRQRNDSAQDALVLFQASLIILNEAVDKTIQLLTEFKKGLSDENDNFVQPGLPVNLNDRFLSRIDLTCLTRYYKETETGKYQVYFEFLKKSSYIGTYHYFFINELNNFRTVFANKEGKFQQHSLLIATKYNEVIAGLKYKTSDNDFAQGYSDLRSSLLDNTDIIYFEPEPENGITLKNRTKLIKEFIKPLISLSQKFVFKDAKANEVYTLANQILAAKVDIDNLKKQWADNLLKDSIEEFKKIRTLIEGLIQS